MKQKTFLTLASLVFLAGAMNGDAAAQRSGFQPITKGQVEAVNQGLAYLKRHQDPVGYWRQDIGYKLNTGYNVTSGNRAHVGVTALALMAFLAGGHLPDRGEYGDVVEKGLLWVIDQVKSQGGQEDGFITAHRSRMYSHAFATLFLAEIYGMYFPPPREANKRKRLRDALETAVRFTFNTQNGEGGWRYHPLAPDSDISITVCQIMALRAANNVGISVPDSVIEKAKEYVRMSTVSENYYSPWNSRRPRGAFRYQLMPNSRTSFALTGAGVTTLFGAGVYQDDEIVREGLRHLKREHRSFTREYGTGEGRRLHRGHYFFYYGHYYAVQAIYQAGGPQWEEYFEYTRNALLRMRDRNTGAWPNDVGPGEVFGTAVATLILEIPYGYLPIFQR